MPFRMLLPSMCTFSYNEYCSKTAFYVILYYVFFLISQPMLGHLSRAPLTSTSQLVFCASVLVNVSLGKALLKVD